MKITMHSRIILRDKTRNRRSLQELWDAQKSLSHIYGSYGILCHMKTTVEIPDALLQEAKRRAARERTTVKALIIEALQRLLGDRRSPGAFQLRKATFGGQGLQHPMAEAPWEQVRDASYEGRGA